MDLSQFGQEGTLILLIIIIGASIYALVDPDFMDSMIFDIREIKSKHQYYRFLTSGFVHNDWFHLGFNLFSLHSFSQQIEITYGKMILYLLFIVSTICGSIYSYFYNNNKTEYRALGASGGVVGIIFASIFLFEGTNVVIPLVPFSVPGYFYAIFYLFMSQYAMRNDVDNIGHDAHIGGAIAGTLGAITILPQIMTQKYEILSIVFVPLMGIFIYDKYFSRKAKWKRK